MGMRFTGSEQKGFWGCISSVAVEIDLIRSFDDERSIASIAWWDGLGTACKVGYSAESRKKGNCK